MSDRLHAEVAELKTEVRYLKWIIPAACGFVALLVLIFWSIERKNIGDRVRQALDNEGVQTAIADTIIARDKAVAAAAEITSAAGTLPWFSVPVLSVDHASGRTGEYFNYDVAYIDRLLGNNNWDNRDHLVVNVRTGQAGLATLWRSPNGGSDGDGHGRWASGSAANQWETGDVFLIVTGRQ